MKPLTLEHAIENNFTPIDCVKYFKPDWSNEACFAFLFKVEKWIENLLLE